MGVETVKMAFGILCIAWCLGMIAVILVSPWIGREKWAERRSRGLCGRCGYDLTGNVSGVCPECGTAVSSDPNPPPLG